MHQFVVTARFSLWLAGHSSSHCTSCRDENSKTDLSLWATNIDFKNRCYTFKIDREICLLHSHIIVGEQRDAKHSEDNYLTLTLI